MSVKALLAAAVVALIALSPSVTECLRDHEEGHPRAWIGWVWIVLVIAVALAFGDVLLGKA